MLNYSVAAIVEAVRSVTGPGEIPLQRPSIGEAEIASLAAYARDDAVGYDAINGFQAALGATMNRRHCTVVSSGTAALHLALMAVGVKRGDEVLMPSLTFVGTANAASYMGAIPHFVDSKPSDLGIDPVSLRDLLLEICVMREGSRPFNRHTKRPIGAIVAVNMLGHPCDLGRIKNLADAFGIPVIEDAAQSLGSEGHGPVGLITCVSFNNNKIVTTNGGGAVLTDDDALAERVWSLATTARIKHPFLMEHSEVAWNYRMGNVNAALGIPQLLRLPKIVAAKRNLRHKYGEAFSDPMKLNFVSSPHGRSNFWLNAVRVPPSIRDEILTALTGEGIGARALFTPLHLLAPYLNCPRADLSGAMLAWESTICLPSSPALGER